MIVAWELFCNVVTAVFFKNVVILNFHVELWSLTDRGSSEIMNLPGFPVCWVSTCVSFSCFVGFVFVLLLYSCVQRLSLLPSRVKEKFFFENGWRLEFSDFRSDFRWVLFALAYKMLLTRWWCSWFSVQWKCPWLPIINNT